jgi:hypothetical protein
MTPTMIIIQAQADGVVLALTPSGRIKVTGCEKAIAQWLPIIRQRKSELLVALRLATQCDYDALLDPSKERLQQVEALLHANPNLTYVLITNKTSDPHNVIFALAIRGRAAFELLIPRDRYDEPLLLDLVLRHGATTH